MNSQQQKTQYHSFISQRRCSLPLSSPKPLHFLSSPRIPKNQNITPFVESNYNCLSPNLKNQVSELKWSTMKEIKEEEFNSIRCLDKGRRVTLPLQKTEGLDGSQKQLPTSPQKHPKAHIKFTYQSNAESLQTLNLKPKSEDSGVFLARQASQQLIQTTKIRQDRISKNQLCSAVFSLFYQPISSIRRKSQQLERLLRQLKKEADLLSSKCVSSCDFSKQCKTSAAETTTSAMVGVKQSQMSLDSSRWSCNQSSSKCNFQTGSNPFRPSLADKIPFSKHLGKTIILNSPTYDFGGLMSPSNQQIEQSTGEVKPVRGQGLTRDWDQLKGLLSQGNEQSMKQSIHCGPDVRANNFSCQMLQNFGRSIKESTVSYQE